MELSEKSKKVQLMFDKISTKYDFLNRLLSFGQDIRWRNQLIKKLPSIQTKDGILVDVACGTGDVTFSVMKKRNDYKKILGFDISEGMLIQARARAKYNSFTNIQPSTAGDITEFTQANGEQLPIENESCHALTIAFGLRNIDNREKALREFFRVLKPNGQLFILEFFPAKRSFLQKVFNFYFNLILPKVGGIFSDKNAYTYLPQSVLSMPKAHEFKDQLIAMGFQKIETISWLSGSTVLFCCSK